LERNSRQCGDDGFRNAASGDASAERSLRNRPFLNVEERLAVDRRKEDGEEPRRLLMPKDGDGRIAGQVGRGEGVSG
jgi:hypothetical protein